MNDNTEGQAPEVNIQEGSTATTVTVSTEPTQETEGEGLLAGKYKTPEELEKAYKELETKLGQQKPQQPDQEGGEEETDKQGDEPDTKEEEKGEVDDSVYEPYGEAVGKILKEANVDPRDAAKEFEETGTLSDETIKAYADAGIPEEMTRAYINGLKQTNDSVSQVTEAQVEQIKAVAGGDEGYQKLANWMTSNLSASEIEAYNEKLTTADFEGAVAAVSAMNNRYLADLGKEGKLIGGKAPTPEGGYASEAEMLEDMAKPEYKTNAAFRARVEKKIAASPNLFMTR